MAATKGKRPKRGTATRRESDGTVGRPKIEFDMDVVRSLAEIQCTYAEIAAVCQVSEDTITRRVQEDAEFAEAIKRGRETGRESLRRVQYKLALRGHPTMLIWLGKQYLDQRDRNELTTNPFAPLDIRIVGPEDGAAATR